MQFPSTPFVRNRFMPSSTKYAKPLTIPFKYKKSFSINWSSEQLVDEALESARQALPRWSNASSFGKRRNLLSALSSKILEHKHELAHLETLTVGKSLRESLADVEDAAQVFRFFSGYADKMYGQTMPGCYTSASGDFTVDSWSYRRAVGVCAVATSYNYPLVLAAWKLAPALACGNCVLLKPHEQTPLSVLYLAQLALDTGYLDSGVLAVLPGGVDTARHLLQSCHCGGVDKVSFTGSTETGRLIMHETAKTSVKQFTLELGGKSPMVVFEDVKNLDRCVEDVCSAIFSNAGQNCSAGSRLFIQRSIYPQMLKKIKQRSEAIRLGDPLDPATDMGTLSTRTQFDKVVSVIADAKSRKVPLLTGGNSCEQDLAGLFIEPTIFTNVHDDDLLAQEEIFGPVLSVMEPFDSEAEVVKRANNSQYGLAGISSL